MSEHLNVEKQTPKRRWYDQIDGVTGAVHVSRDLPEAIQHLVAKNLNHYIDQYRNQSKNGKQTLSMGASRTMGLYKAAQKQRWYDQHSPQMHRAFTMMSVIPESLLSRYANRVIEVGNFIEYRRTHDFYYNPWDIAHTVDNLLSQNLSEEHISLTQSDEGIRLTTTSHPVQDNPIHPTIQVEPG